MSVEGLKQIWYEWQIEGKPLGKGSFGVVYKVVDFISEIQVMESLKGGQNVVSVEDYKQVDTIRLKLMKIAARAVQSARFITFKRCCSCPYKKEFYRTLENIQQLTVQLE